jgi:hypothetical protein
MDDFLTKKILFIWLILFVPFFPKGQNTKVVISKSNDSTVIEEKILDTISKLPECRERAAYIEKETKGKRHLTIVIYERPSKEFPYYWVKAWEDNGIIYATHFNFYIYTNPFNIKYYDTMNNIVISLKEWRQQTKDKAFKIQ